MKKILSSLLAFAMVLALFSGVVVFNASAASEVNIHIPFVNQYTLEQVNQYKDTMLYNGYQGDATKNPTNVSFSKDAFGRLVYTATTPEVATDSYRHIVVSTGQSGTIRQQTNLIDGINIFGNAELSNKTKLVLKFGFDDAAYTALGKKAPYFYFGSSKSKTYIYNQSIGVSFSDSAKTGVFTCTLSNNGYTSSANSGPIKSLAQAYDGLIDTMFIDLRFANAATPTEVKFWIEDAYVVAAADTTALLSAIRSAKAAGVDDALITAAETVYKNTASTQAEVDAAAESLGAGVRIQLPFINQYTLAQAQKMGTKYTWGDNTNNGRDYTFAKDDQGRTVVNFTTGTTIDTYGGVSAYLSTGTQGNFYYANPLIDGINVFDGVDLSNKSVIAFKWGGDDNFNNVVKSINLVLKNSSKKILLELKNGVKNAEGYYEYRLSGMTFNNTTNYNELGIKTISEVYDGIIDGVIFVFRANTVDTTVSCWLEDAYVVGSADDRELLSEIRKAKADGILPQALIDQAETVYKAGSLQSQVDAAVDMLKNGFSAYDYYPLTGFTATTQDELDLLSGNVGYADGAMYNSVSSKLELTGNPGEVKLTTNPANDQKYNQSIVTYKKADGATLTNNPWTPLDNTVDMSTMDGVRFKLTDSNGKPVSYYGQYRLIVKASGWGNYWYYRGQPELDDDGYNVIDFDRLFRASTTNTEMTFSHEVVKLDGISFLMYNADTTLYFSDFQAYKRNVPRSYGMEFVTLNGFQDWTQTNVDAHNIADLQGTQSSIGIDKTAKALRGTATQGVKPINPKADPDNPVYYPNQWSHVISTQTNADKTVEQQNGDLFGSYKKLGEMLKWDGIRIGFSKSDGTAPVPYSWDGSKHVQVKLTLVGSGQKAFSNQWYQYYTANYSCGSSTAYGTDLGDLTFSNYDEGYLYFYFNDFKDGWYDKTILNGNKNNSYGNMILLVQGGGMNDQWRRYTYSDMQLFRKVIADPTEGLMEANYTAESWKALTDAYEAHNEAAIADAIAALEPAVTIATTDNMMTGWTTTNVNEVVTANSNKLDNYILNGNADFSNNTTFEANDNLSLTAGVDFTTGGMGWKNMDRSGTLADVANGGYPALTVAGLAKSEGIRFKLTVSEGGSYDHIVVGLSNCAGHAYEQYATLVPASFVDGYVNIPWSAFEKASWGKAFDLTNIEQAIVFLVEVHGATAGTKVTISDLKGYVVATKEAIIGDLWEYNYTPESWAPLAAAANALDLDAAAAAKAALVPADIKTVTGNLMEGWTTADVNATVTANSGKLCDSIGEGLNVNGAWNAGDFSNNTTFEADSNLSLTATADFTGKAMGWKNMDRSKTLQNVTNGAYPALNVAGLSKADGIRFKLESNKPVERILIGLSTCEEPSPFATGGHREMYAMKIKPEYVAEDGYINIPWTYFEAAFWSQKFAQNELDLCIVFIVEAYGAENGTKLTISDLRGYKTIVAPTNAEIAALTAAIEKLEGYDFDARYTDLIADAKAQLTAVDADYVLDATAAVLAVTDKIEAVDRSALTANIDAVKAIDATLWATEIAAGVDAYYNLDATASDIAAAAKVLQRIIDKPEAPTVTMDSVTDTSITVVGIRGAKYKLNDGEWQDSNVFENLLPNKAYAISAYIVETEDFIASDVSVAVDITTAKGSFGTATVTISGTERYTEVMTATVADVPEYLGGYTIEWRNEAGDTVGTGETYTLAAADVGSFVYAVLVSENAGDTVASDPSGIIGKGIIKGYTLPTASDIMYPQTIGDSVLSGGNTGVVTGTWSWVVPSTQPLSSQSGSAFDVIFTPDANFINLYEIIEAKVTITVNPAPYEPQALEDTDKSLTITGEFIQNVEMQVTDIVHTDPAYLALLRASGKDNSGMKKLVLFKNFTFTVNGEEIDDVYDGDLTVTSFVGKSRAGQTYSVWFFIDGKPVNYQGTVDADGVIVVEHVIL